MDVAESFTACSDFVFAYRVQKIYVSWRWGSLKSKEKVGGALSGIGMDSDVDLDEIEEEDPEPQEINGATLESDICEAPVGLVKLENNDDIYEKKREYRIPTRVASTPSVK